jgi:hypothetical protein
MIDKKTHKMFENKLSRPDILRNFTLIHKALGKVNIDLDSNIAQKIINKEQGAIQNLLFQIISKHNYKKVNIDNLNKKTKKDMSKVKQIKLENKKVRVDEENNA